MGTPGLPALPSFSARCVVLVSRTRLTLARFLVFDWALRAALALGGVGGLLLAG